MREVKINGIYKHFKPERGGAGQESVHGGTPGGLSPVI